MQVNDPANAWTDEQIAALEQRIAEIYKQASDELQGTIDDYFDSFKKRDAEMKALIGTTVNGKTFTQQDYLQWRLAQIGRGARFEALRDKLAERYTRANIVAAAYINSNMAAVYAMNRNYTGYTIERLAGNIDFTLFNEEAVRRLIVEQPDLMPYYPPARAVNRGIDLDYGKRQITSHITSGILQGKSVQAIAADLGKSIPTMEQASATRAARTAMTGAQNAGRQAGYKSAADLGIKVRKRWLATLDGRTRHSHQKLDGQVVDWDQDFTSPLGKIKYPGDPSAKPANVYNCRCTMITVEAENIVAEPVQRRAIHPVTGESVLVKDMDYEDYLLWKESLQA